jgi:hypothetical protein
MNSLVENGVGLDGRLKAVGKYVDGEFDGGWEVGSSAGKRSISSSKGVQKMANRLVAGSATMKTDNSGTRAHTRTARRLASVRCT